MLRVDSHVIFYFVTQRRFNKEDMYYYSGQQVSVAITCLNNQCGLIKSSLLQKT